jgi:hypothetical protein
MKIIISDELEQTITKLKKKDIALFRRVQRKISQISDCDETTIYHFKKFTARYEQLQASTHRPFRLAVHDRKRCGHL